MLLATRIGGLKDILFLLVAGVTFIIGYRYVGKDICFIYYLRVGMGDDFALFRELGDTFLGILCCRFPTLGCAIHTTPTKEDERLLGWRGEGGEDDLDLGGLRMGDRNHFPDVSGHWCDSGTQGSSSSR